jgi:hypothetical protein
MLTKQVSLFVSAEYKLPDVYTKGCIEEIEEALWIGATIQNSIKTRRSNDEVKKISELKDTEISKIQQVYNDKITKLLDEIRIANNEKDKAHTEYTAAIKSVRENERESTNRDWEEKIRILKKDHEILVTRYETLEVKRRQLEESRDQDIKMAVKRTEELMEKIINAKEEQLIKMESAYSKLQDVITKQTDEIHKLAGSLGKRSANVKTKGSDYEEEFREKIMRYFGLCKGFSVRDTRLGMGHEMDFSMDMEGHVVLWELKNYNNPVPKSEVDKFLRDLKENPQAKIGVMISRYTDIYNKCNTGNMLTEFDGDKMMIYISRFEEFCGSDESRTFQMISSLFRIWWEHSREENNTIDRADLIREIEKVIEEISKRRVDWRRHKAHLDEINRWASDMLDEMESRLDRIFKKVRCDTLEIAENNIHVPDGIFREMDGDKERGWIQSIMKVCESGGEIEVRELVDLLSKTHKLSKDTIRSNIMSVILDNSVIKKGVIKYIKGISKKVPKCDIVFNK